MHNSQTNRGVNSINGIVNNALYNKRKLETSLLVKRTNTIALHSSTIPAQFVAFPAEVWLSLRLLQTATMRNTKVPNDDFSAHLLCFFWRSFVLPVATASNNAFYGRLGYCLWQFLRRCELLYTAITMCLVSGNTKLPGLTVGV